MDICNIVVCCLAYLVLSFLAYKLDKVSDEYILYKITIFAVWLTVTAALLGKLAKYLISLI